ncbi:Metabotropic glutamate receptor 3 [Portunus trituberculatus]|uniref:Metabotropic glutamate receptor 3 n=1 Tax=Portunus trituberculatus TaxID=210409 RepID=A0A5B7IGW8_PORTR|nr:Metabotropic glutamate receptor 3 [Portunus trituberculatus]
MQSIIWSFIQSLQCQNQITRSLITLTTQSFPHLTNQSPHRGFVQLGCLFFPKVHVVLFKPEKNTRDAVMSVMRHSSNRGDSLYKKQPDHHSAPAVFVLNGGGHQNGAPPTSSPLPHPVLRDSPGRVNQVYMSTIHSRQEDMDYL